jgi:BlaI family transcriptional regulator, penicillinase repressor
MTKTKLPRPTEAELDILRLLWSQGPSTVRDVHSALEKERPIGYTTVLKFMQIMAEKGLVQRDERERAHVYRAALGEEQTQRQLVRHLVERAFGGSATKLVLQALTAERASAEEIQQVRAMLEEYERERQS